MDSRGGKEGTEETKDIVSYTSHLHAGHRDKSVSLALLPSLLFHYRFQSILRLG